MADQTKLRKRLEALLKRPDNQKCADCGRRGPRWASANLGTFFCIECSGIHRNLGVHISFVRSVNLDTWTVKQVEFMEEWGNARANALYEAKMPSGYARPGENDTVRVVERFIRDKYEHKKFIGDTTPPPSAQQEVEEKRKPSRPAAAPPPARVAPQKTVPTAPAPAPVAETNLLDFFDEPAPPPQHVNPSSQEFGDPFGAGSGFTSAQSSANAQSVIQATPPVDPFFSGQTSVSAAPHQTPTSNQKPVASNDAILSLFGNGSGGGGGGGGMQQSRGMQNPGGFGISTMPPPQSQMHGMMPPAAPMMGHSMMGHNMMGHNMMGHPQQPGMVPYGGAPQQLHPSGSMYHHGQGMMQQGFGMQQQNHQQQQQQQGFHPMQGQQMQGQQMQGQQMGYGGPMNGGGSNTGYPGMHPNQGFR